MNAEEWENYPFPGVSPLIGYPIQNGQPRNHIQTNNKSTLSGLYLYNCVYITTIVKEAIDLRVWLGVHGKSWRVESWKELREGERKGKVM